MIILLPFLFIDFLLVLIILAFADQRERRADRDTKFTRTR